MDSLEKHWCEYIEGGQWEDTDQVCLTPGSGPVSPPPVLPVPGAAGVPAGVVCMKQGVWDEAEKRPTNMHVIGWAAAAFTVGFFLGNRR
jgi:hypothetical protein